MLPTDRIAGPKQIEILRAYGAHGKNGEAVTNADVGGAVSLSPATVSLANSFFLDVGLLARADSGFVPCQDVINFAGAHDWDAARAPRKLAPVFERSWFWETIRGRVSFRALEEREVIALLAEASGATPEHKPQLKTLVDFMEVAGLLERDGQMLRAAKQERVSVEPSPVERTPPTSAAKEEAPAPGEQIVRVQADFIPHVFQLRKSLKVVIPLPTDLSPKDVERLYKWMQTLPIPEDSQ